MATQGFFSPGKKRMAGEKDNNPFLSVKVDSVKVANNLNQYNDQTPSLDYAPDRVGDYIRDSETKSYRDERTEDEKNQDTIKKYFTREDGGVFKNKDEFNRKMTTYYTDKDGNPAAINAFGEKVNYDTDTIKRYIATDAKEKYQAEKKRKLDDAVTSLNTMTQKVDDLNYYKRNLDFNEKGEADPANKYVLTAPEMKERIKGMGVNQTIDKYGNIHAYKPERYESTFSTEDRRKLGTMPSMGISEAGREQAKLNRLQQAKEKPENKSILQRVGDFVGNTFNKLTGTQAAGAESINSERAREAVEKASSYLGNATDSRPGVSKGFGRSTKGTNTSSTVSIGRKGSTGSKKSSRGARGSSSSRSKGGSFGGGRKSNTGSKKASRGTAGSRSKGGPGKGQSRSGGTTGRKASSASKSRTGRSRSQCDIRTKIDISPLINSNLVKDNLAEIAYFVQEIKN